MKTTKYLIFLLTTLLLASCKGIPYKTVSDTDTETFYVSSNKVECYLYGESEPSLCLQIQDEEDDDDWSLIQDDEIEDFSYTWGTEYELTLVVESLSTGSSTSPYYSYEYEDTTDTDSASTLSTFEISITGSITSDYIKEVSGSNDTYEIFADKEIECNTDSVCEGLKDAIDDNESIMLHLRHPSSSSDPLILRSICSGIQGDDFDDECN